MRKILYSSPYIPSEWIVAHGFVPVRVTPTGVSCTLTVLDREGVCPFVRSFVSEALAAKDALGIVMTTTCDQMRRAYDVVAGISKVPVFLMNVPGTWQTVAARKLYMEELKRLGRFLVRLGGTRPSNSKLAKVMLDSRFEYPASSHDPYQDKASRRSVALVGGHLRKEDLAILDIVKECGGYIALDATETAVRGLRRKFDRRTVFDEPLLELTDAYFDAIPDVFRRPNNAFYEWLVQNLKEYNIRAIILHRYLWCDLWHAEVERLRQRTGLTVLDLVSGGEESTNGHRIRTRIAAFMEMLT